MEKAVSKANANQITTMKRELNFQGNTPLLYLIATPIGNLEEFSPRAINVLKEMDFVACEDTRNSVLLLKRFGLDIPLISCHEHNEEKASEKILSLMNEGKKVAYMSDAGYPIISDPGERLARKVIAAGFKVSVVNGPNAGLCALVGSGIASKHFYFFGFLESKPSARRRQLEELKNFHDTIIFYESPHRIEDTLKDMLVSFGANRHVALARELTKTHEEYIRGSLEELVALPSETIIGEIVIIVEGAPLENKEINDETIKERLHEKLETMKSKDAIKEVSLELSIAKNRVYDIYLKNWKN